MFWKKNKTTNTKVFANGWVLGYKNDELVQVFIVQKEVKDPEFVGKFMEKSIWNFTGDADFYPIAEKIEMGDTVYKVVNHDFAAVATPYLD